MSALRHFLVCMFAVVLVVSPASLQAASDSEVRMLAVLAHQHPQQARRQIAQVLQRTPANLIDQRVQLQLAEAEALINLALGEPAL